MARRSLTTRTGGRGSRSARILMPLPSGQLAHAGQGSRGFRIRHCRGTTCAWPAGGGCSFVCTRKEAAGAESLTGMQRIPRIARNSWSSVHGGSKSTAIRRQVRGFGEEAEHPTARVHASVEVRGARAKVRPHFRVRETDEVGPTSRREGSGQAGWRPGPSCRRTDWGGLRGWC
jgi:hypothetical protein